MNSSDTKKTTLYDFHLGEGANMSLFGGYEMPLWYAGGAKGEHLAVIEKAGAFDTSHMSVVTVKGEGAKKVLQHCFTKDLDSCIGLKKLSLANGRCVYGLFLTEAGTVIDDALVYMLGDEDYMVVVNAGMGETIAAHLKDHCQAGVVIKDCTSTIGKMDLQGPLAGKILQRIVKAPEQLFASLPYFSFKGAAGECVSETTVELLDGTPFMVSRTGYTGEFGFEFFIERSQLEHLWNIVLKAGGDDLTACGLAARDSLRAGAVLPLSHQDIGDWVFANTPWPFALPWEDDDQKRLSKEFIGSDVVGEVVEDDFTYPFAGFDPRKIQVTEETVVVGESGENIGRVLTCTTDMGIGRVEDEIFSLASTPENGCPEDFTPRGLSCGFIKVSTPLNYGDVVSLVCGKRKIKVEIRKDIRPARTARKAVATMLDNDK